MADKASATAKVDKHGRLYLPSQTRKVLDIHGVEASVDLDILVIERGDENDE